MTSRNAARPADDAAGRVGPAAAHARRLHRPGTRARENLHVSIAATRQRSEALDRNVLLHGPPGPGKTTPWSATARAWGSRAFDVGTGARTACLSGGHLDEPEGARGALHRRSDLDEPGHRRNPPSGDGGFRARHHHRPGAGREIGEGSAPAFHAHRRNDAGRFVYLAASRALRHRPSALLRLSGTDPTQPSSRDRQAFSASRLRRKRPRRLRAGRAARRVLPTGYCGAFAISPKSAPTAGLRPRCVSKRSTSSSRSMRTRLRRIRATGGCC